MACCKFYFFVVFIVFQFLYIFHQVSVWECLRCLPMFKIF
jgi:hypothetical protein